jgi:multidrug resistance efflux pump
MTEYRFALGLLFAVAACDRTLEMDGDLSRPVFAVTDVPGPVGRRANVGESADGMLGLVVPRQEVHLSAEVVARVREINVAPGQHVVAGEIVARLDDRAQRNELRSALASVRSADADARRLALDAHHSAGEVDRAERIAAFLSEDELLELRHAEGSLALDSRRAGADAAERRARADLIAQRIAGAVIQSPFTGLVVERLAEPGAVVGAGEPLLHIISEALIVRFAAREGDLDAIRVGAAVRVVFPDLGIELESYVQSVAPEIDAATRIVMIEAPLELDEAQRAEVRAGAIARVRAVPQ